MKIVKNQLNLKQVNNLKLQQEEAKKEGAHVEEQKQPEKKVDLKKAENLKEGTSRLESFLKQEEVQAAPRRIIIKDKKEEGTPLNPLRSTLGGIRGKLNRASDDSERLAISEKMKKAAEEAKEKKENAKAEWLKDNPNGTDEEFEQYWAEQQPSKSAIRDVDMAEEMKNFSKSSVLLQAAKAFAAQANGTEEAQQADKPESAEVREECEYDDNGNLIKRTVYKEDGKTVDFIEECTYDEENRINGRITTTNIDGEFVVTKEETAYWSNDYQVSWHIKHNDGTHIDRTINYWHPSDLPDEDKNSMVILSILEYSSKNGEMISDERIEYYRDSTIREEHRSTQNSNYTKEYYPNGNLKKLESFYIDENNHGVTYNALYDEDGKCTGYYRREEDENGNMIRNEDIDYDDDGNIKGGFVFTRELYENGNVKTEVLEDYETGERTTTEYDENGNIKSKEIKKSFNNDGIFEWTMKYEYYENGEIKSYEYINLHSDGTPNTKERKEYDENGNVISYTFEYCEDGQVSIQKTEYNKDGTRSAMEYSSFNNGTLEKIEKAEYYANGKIKTKTTEDYKTGEKTIVYYRSDGTKDWEYNYDKNGNLKNSIDYQPNGNYERITEYYENGKVHFEQLYTRDESNYVERYSEYDEYGNLIKESRDTDGSGFFNEIDELKYEAGKLVEYTTYTLDSNGNVKTKTTEDYTTGERTITEYDEQGNVVSERKEPID